MTVLGLITACGAELEVSAAGPESPSVIEPGSGDQGTTTQDTGTTTTEPDTTTTEPATTTRPDATTTEPDTTSTDKPVGDFELNAPPAVVVDSAFNVEVVVRAGGDVTIQTESANCELVRREPNGARIGANAIGTCLLVAVQRETPDHDPAPDERFAVEITKPEGEFELVISPTNPRVGDSVSVTVTKIFGGEVGLSLNGSACGNVSVSRNLLLADAVAPGRCTVTATQLETDFATGGSETRTFRVLAATTTSSSTTPVPTPSFDID